MYLFLLNPHKRVSLVCYSLHSTMYLFLRFSDIVIPAYALLYIPQCIYFYPSSYALEVPFSEPLHSTMYLFLHQPEIRRAVNLITLHSTMYLFLLHLRSLPAPSVLSLHSTMYLFLPCTPASGGSTVTTSLHSTMYLFLRSVAEAPLDDECSLHSTMYLFLRNAL